MRYILLLLLMMMPMQTEVYAEMQDTPPVYMIYSTGPSLLAGRSQGTAVSLRVHKNYGWFITASHVLKGRSVVVIQGHKYPVRAMDSFRTTGLIPDGLTILRTIEKIPHDDLNTYLMDVDRQPKVGDKVWLVGYPSGRLQSKQTYVTQLIKDQFLTRTYLSFGASGGLVVYDNGSLAGIIHGFAEGKGREGVHSNVALFARSIQENYPFLVPRSQDNEKRIALHDDDVKNDDVKNDDVKNDDHRHNECDCGCVGCEDCTNGECPCETDCRCDSDCACRIKNRSEPHVQDGPPLPPDQEDPVGSTPLSPFKEPGEPDGEPAVEEPVVEELVTEKPLKLEGKEEDHVYIDEKLEKLKEEIISIIKDTHSIDNAVVSPVIPKLAPELTPESKPDPQLVTGSSEPEEESVGMLGNLINSAGWILPTLGVAIPGGALGWFGIQGVLSLFRRKKKSKEEGDENIPPLFRRDVTEAEQIIGLRQSEQREPIFDTMRGILFEDEFNSNPDQSFKEAFAAINSKFNQIAPVATQHTRVKTKN